jgi:hypothetical protein
VVLVSGVDLCSLRGPPIEQDGGLMCRQSEYSLTKSYLEFDLLDLLRYTSGENIYYAIQIGILVEA